MAPSVVCEAETQAGGLPHARNRALGPAAQPSPPPPPTLAAALCQQALSMDAAFVGITLFFLVALFFHTSTPAERRACLADAALCLAGLAVIAIRPRAYARPAVRLPFITLLRARLMLFLPTSFDVARESLLGTHSDGSGLLHVAMGQLRAAIGLLASVGWLQGCLATSLGVPVPPALHVPLLAANVWRLMVSAPQGKWAPGRELRQDSQRWLLAACCSSPTASAGSTAVLTPPSRAAPPSPHSVQGVCCREQRRQRSPLLGPLCCAPADSISSAAGHKRAPGGRGGGGRSHRQVCSSRVVARGEGGGVGASAGAMRTACAKPPSSHSASPPPKSPKCAQASIGFVLPTLAVVRSQLREARRWALARRARGDGGAAVRQLRASIYERCCAPLLEGVDYLGGTAVPVALAALGGYVVAVVAQQQ